jgi:methylthioribose-1-phosphate isomerase
VGAEVSVARCSPLRPRQQEHAIQRGSYATSEVTHHAGKQLTPNYVGVWNPAFDVTPAKYVTAVITARGVLRAPYAESLERLSHEAAVLA